MTNAEWAEKTLQRNINQVGFVTRDLNRSMQQWIDYLGIGPWLVIEYDSSYWDWIKGPDGEELPPIKMRIAVAQTKTVQIELVEPVSGTDEYMTHLEEKGEGLHHICEEVNYEDLKRMIHEFKEKGIDVWQMGKMKDNYYALMSSEGTIDFTYELGVSSGPRNFPPHAISWYPPEIAEK